MQYLVRATDTYEYTTATKPMHMLTTYS